MENERVCAECGAPTIYKEGVAKKTGKPWAGYFCTDTQCKTVDWTTPKEQSPKTEHKFSPQFVSEVERSVKAEAVVPPSYKLDPQTKEMFLTIAKYHTALGAMIRKMLV